MNYLSFFFFKWTSGYPYFVQLIVIVSVITLFMFTYPCSDYIHETMQENLNKEYLNKETKLELSLELLLGFLIISKLCSSS